MRKSSKVVITAAVVVALLGGGSSAFAWWSGAGGGTGTATTSAAATNNIAVKQTNAPVTGLTPGGPAQTLSGNFDNNGDVDVTLSGVAISLSVAKASGAVGACTTADYTLVQPTSPASAATQSILKNSTASGTWAGSSIAMKNTSSNQNGCIGATLTFTYAVN